MTLIFTSSLTVLLQRNTPLFLFLCCCSLHFSGTECGQIFIPFGRVKREFQVWWSAEVKEAVSERRKIFASAHINDEDCQAYVFAHRRASHVIVKAKAEAWQATCFSLSPKLNSKSVHSLLVLLLAFLSHLPSLLTSLTVPLPKSWLRSSPTT